MRTLFFIFSIWLTACSESYLIEAPEGLQHWDVIKVEGDTTGFVNQQLVLKVFYPRSSGCDYVSEFALDNQGKTIYIKAYGTTIDGPCTLASVPGAKLYEFTSDNSGRFELKFINRDGSVVKHYINME